MTRRIISALCCFVLLSALSAAAFAVEVPDLQRKGSVSVAMTYQGQSVAGGSLTLYRVAEVHLENQADYRFRLAEAYANSGVSLDDLSASGIALALAEYTAAQNIQGVKAEIDAEGKVSFQGLELGLYLLVQEDAAPGYAAANPFLVTVPGKENGSYVYDVDASPKLSLELAPTEPTEPPTEPTEPTPPDLPQTGLNQWPIPVLAVGGVLLVLLGVVFYTSEKRGRHES